MLEDKYRKRFEKIKPVLQYRWKIGYGDHNQQLVYYGLRNLPFLERKILIDRDVASIISAFNGNHTLREIIEKKKGVENVSQCIEVLEGLIEKKVIVDKRDLKQPATLENYQTCVKCVNNNYVLPGLEFNEEGICVFCQLFEKAKGIEKRYTISGEEILEFIKDNNSRFDVMVLYTGGKDSSFLLWYLAKKLGVRVLAVTWDLPFANESARRNMREARRILSNVEFIERTMPWDIIKSALRTVFSVSGMPCICPIISNVLFYPVAVQEGIPLIMDGIEAPQAALLNFMDSTLFGSKSHMSDREITLFQMKKLSSPCNGKQKTDLDIILAGAREVLWPAYTPINHIIENADKYRLPVLKRLRTENVYSRWKEVVGIIKRELNWQMPAGQEGFLHTSCQIETVKDFCQFQRFKQMRTTMMPQSIIEISLAVRFGQITREEGFKELGERGYFSQPDAFKILLEKLELTEEKIENTGEELPYVFQGCRI
ncbi:MAG: hypothetical protein JW983_02180 [Elusimicrobia bacterium]|nr:hypothetical protein [Elusimicrobiota bacterium]